MIIALTIIGILVSFLVFSILYYKKDMVELLALALTGFFCAYVLGSGLLFWSNTFTITKALTAALIMLAAALIAAIFALRRRPTISFHYKTNLIPVCIFLISLPMIFNKFGYFGMGQDQGVYQVKALALIEGENDNYFNFEEYDTLTEKQDQEAFEYEMGKTILGFYRYDPKVPSLNQEDFQNKVTGVLHGVPTYSALLALYGSIFGYAQMAGIQTVFAFCIIFLMYAVMRNLKVRKRIRTAGLLIFIASPLVIWTAKSTLTEVFICVLVLLYLYFMVDRKCPGYVWMAAIPMVAFSFFHATIYTIMPMLVVIHFVLYYMTRDRQYLAANAITLVGYVSGFFMMRECATVYTVGNYMKIFIPGINEYNFHIVVSVVVSVMLALTAALWLIPMEKQEPFRAVVTAFLRKYTRAVVRILLIVAVAALIAAYVFSGAAYNYLTIYAYVISSGILLIPFLFIVFVWRPQFITAHRDHLLLTMMFVYMVIMYSVVFKSNIAYYYYYGRYIVPYIPIIIILAALRVSRLNVRFDKVKTIVPLVAAIGYYVIMSPYNLTLATQMDDTTVSWEIIDDLSTLITDQDAVIIDSNLSAQLKMPIKIMTNAATFPVFGDINTQIEKFSEQYKNVYYISESNWFLFRKYELENVYARTNVIWEDLSNTNQVKRSLKPIPFSTEFSRTTSEIHMYRCWVEY